MGKKWEKKLKELSESLAELGKKAEDASEDAKAAWDLKDDFVREKKSTLKGSVAALQENARLAGEENKSRMSAALLKAQMTLKAKGEDWKNATDKKALEAYIDGNVAYIQDCYETAAYLIANAQLAILDTVEAAEEYEKRFGTTEEG